MRVVSLVPSWTETLIEAGVNVIGRTRFCIHPSEEIRSIAVVGGTKSFDVDHLRAQKPDLIVMDREENTREMFELAETIAPVHVSHVRHVRELPGELRSLRTRLGLAEGEEAVVAKLEEFARRYETALNHPPARRVSIPGVLKVVKGEPKTLGDFVYVIWRNPWMCVAANTFIGSMLEQAGFDLSQLFAGENSSAKYPQLESLPREATILLSSEPFPFLSKTPDLQNQNVAIVDGELYSWFGLRALKFLESLRS